ncbi:type II secretion system protein J [Blastopirellula marina]|uniref:Uncharacterized protein n=1 Tax=Blastopirellula marina TaxID=124 RepID=A0A2S8F821_9BACT|nr:prepilin-type N-terminal cleavage/methylation domain-containing protein [Blastopirellula marina]PQO28309.1 hypothetical protein C5Y98_25785 [Blastopirellula marina]PTL41849.1 hypothetical protein C5Y97_25800 [Blastopirellula marina]
MWNIRTPHTARRARGLTLVEMLMATALSLIMFAAVAQIFGMMGGAMRDARAKIELSGNLRSVANHLQTDLNNLTVDVLPWVQPGSNQGYFEIIEGPDRDVDFASYDVISTNTGHNGSMSGDADDILCFTAYSKDEPFIGLIQGHLVANTTSNVPHAYWIDISNPDEYTVITSQYAEIVYFTKLTPSDDRNLEDWSNLGTRDANETVTLYRRVFLIRPDIYFGNPNSTAAGYSYNQDASGNPLNEDRIRNNYDLSMYCTPATNNTWKTNSLEDLQDRKRRVCHSYAVASSSSPLYPFPNPILPTQLRSFEQLYNDIGSFNIRDRTGEDVILTKTLAFDVKVFDPGAVVRQEASGTIAGQPGDLYYPTSGDTAVYESYTAATAMTGAFVDLNWTASSRYSSVPGSPLFSGTPAASSGLNSDQYSPFTQSPSMALPLGAAPTGNLYRSYYDTWPLLYESDGNDQDKDGVVDEGTNGFDDNNNGIVDDVGEYETSPPYPAPLRGISVTVRAIEEGTRQVRQDTIMADFLPK